jgi:hypothetical protein
MNDGVRILLERMETHPEEFDALGRDSKWENLVYRFHEWLDEEDKEVFKNAIKKMRQQKFTELVMEELVDPVRKLTREEKIPLASIPTFSVNDLEHIQAQLKILGQTPIAGVTQTL